MTRFIKALSGDGDLINIAYIKRVSTCIVGVPSQSGADIYVLSAIVDGEQGVVQLAAGSLEFVETKKKELEPFLNVVNFTPEDKTQTW